MPVIGEMYFSGVGLPSILFCVFYLRGVAACGFAHAGVDGVTGGGESACYEGAKAARSSCDDDDVFHFDSPVLRVM